jgi:maltose O-acetyltransferase
MGMMADFERSRWLRRCRSVGARVRVLGRPSIYVEGDGAIAIGADAVLHSRPVASHLVAGHGATLSIGEGVVIGHGAAIAAYERVTIGAATVVGPYAIVMDTNFHGAAGDQSVSHDTRPIMIGAGCRIGARVTLTRGVELGDGARVLAGSVVSSSVPAGMCAAGARARVIGPASVHGASWDGAFGLLPVLAMDAFGLDAPPDVSASIGELMRGDETALDRLAREIAATFGVAVDRAALTANHRLEAIAAAIEERRGRA